VTAVENLIN